ncbi:hypothetical protein ABT158_16990 [Nonomuraea sp. NPDC001636]|uniref:hypothetical protein n=1 Tax=Nonomuraea sp. NPDC001636 TaxID=3154391 RepID=UPI00331C9889
MRQKSARLGVALAMAGALAVGTLSVAAPAGASATSWTPYQAYRTLQNCVSAGTTLLVTKGYKEYDCRWDSPYYMLWLRK